ncbi:L-histidine N(alpha)-methyltransferase [Streptomyces sp. YIM 98790]|uniref:L-histidine N(alpha)-methyltransferase n=1 Tax=Streptomyces sp. YIM 98790 TaxID=2689077 RepID=UPI001407B7F3|nr:L-histidine N(alpha)-methyltransferase [Streptomyces sp. YIM 98790]
MTSRFSLDHRLPPDHFDRELRADARAGLTATPKVLPPKWFYDERGSTLFDEITRLPEYYLTRAEREILHDRAADIARLTGARSLAELGSGTSEKTRVLLDALTAAGTLERYAPVDVSPAPLREAGEALCAAYPSLRITATVADFEHDLALPRDPAPVLVAFLGSTLGNLDAPRRAAFFTALRAHMSPGDSLLLGADLVKDPQILVRAYDDSQGITAAFNRNVLHVLNHGLGADFQPDAFAHRAVWNPREERMEMRLRSRTAQSVKLPAAGITADFAEGEELLTEISVKFRRDRLAAELAHGGFTLTEWWTDTAARYALLLAAPTA